MTPVSLSNSCTINPPSLTTWIIALTVYGGCCTLIALPLGIILYYLRAAPVLLRRTFSLVTGVGVAVSVPLVVTNIEIDHTAHWLALFLVAMFGFSTFFKIINAGFDHFPRGVEADLRSWLCWFIILPEPELAKGKVVKATQQEILQRVKYFVYEAVGLSLIVSILMHLPGYNLHLENVPRFVSILINGYLHIWFLYLFASCGMEFSAIFNMPLTGVRLKPSFDNPLLASRSVKEGWGERWNQPVQLLLKRTFYVPSRKLGLDRATSTLVTFLGSGVLHEYMFFIHNRTRYVPGEATIYFFILGSVLMVGESWLWNQLSEGTQQSLQKIPAPIVSLCMTLVAAFPFERFFIQSWFDSGCVEAIAKAVPYIAC